MLWNNHRINLIDTPGHVDFTIEVERSLRVLDGAICLLDGVAGVEAQTETVWNQSNRHRIPRIIFVNKLDRQGADFTKSIETVKDRLIGWGFPLLVQLPVFAVNQNGLDTYSVKDTGSGVFLGVLDLVEMTLLKFNQHSSGSVITRTQIDTHHSLYQDMSVSRMEMVEQLSNLDDEIVDIFLSNESHLDIKPHHLTVSIRKLTHSGLVVPVLCGASFRNIGVQPLLDAVCAYLPSPDLSPSSVAILDGNRFLVRHGDEKLVALAFKVVFDSKRGPLVFVRIYSGELSLKDMIRVSSRPNSTEIKPMQIDRGERATRLLELYADDYEEISTISVGNIGAIVGLKNFKTGDTIVKSNDLRNLICQPVEIPPPVFMRSIEVTTLSQEKRLHEALSNLQREDPSLTVHTNEETGQLLLGGMGELHLEISGERLIDTHKIACKLGKVEIAYRETVQSDFSESYNLAHEQFIFDKKTHSGVEIGIKSLNEGDSVIDIVLDEEIIVRIMKDYNSVDEVYEALRTGIQGALSRGPLVGLPVSHVKVTVLSIKLFGPELSTLHSIRTAARFCVINLLSRSSVLLEPIMGLVIIVPQKYVGNVTRDMVGTRRGQVLGLNTNVKVEITCKAPLVSLIGYASELRSMTGGTGEWNMSLTGYERIPTSKQAEILKGIRGY